MLWLSSWARTCIDRRIGGLEKLTMNSGFDLDIDRRIGGLEIVGLYRGYVHVIDRRIGGLETQIPYPS